MSYYASTGKELVIRVNLKINTITAIRVDKN